MGMGAFWKKAGAAILAGALALAGGAALPAAFAAEAGAGAAAQQSASNYGLTENIRAAVKSAAVIKTDAGLQISATIRVYNAGKEQERLPEHEVRVRTADGIEYALQASAANKRALKPKEIGELTYMTVLDSEDSLKIEAISIKHVDIYEYPKKVTELLTMPAKSVWYDTGAENEAREVPSVAWGQAFTIPDINSGIVYKPVDFSIQNAGQRAAVITLLAHNPAAAKVKVPAFKLDVATPQKVYAGQAALSNPATLEPGEKAYLYFTIPIGNSTDLTQLRVMTTDVFVTVQNEETKLTPIHTGKLLLSLPPVGLKEQAPAYAFGESISFDELNTIIDTETEVALMELHVHENPEEGYKTAIAKFRVTNHGSEPKAFPLFETELVNEAGVSYRGIRQAMVANVINPDLSYIVSYSYQLPKSEESDAFTVRLLDGQTVAPYAAKIAAVQANVQEEESRDTFALYPFTVKIKSAEVSFSYANYTYFHNIRLDLDIVQEDNVVVDNGFSRLRFEIVDSQGRVLGFRDASFVGPQKLISGKQVIDASNAATDQHVFPVRLNIYEVFDTPAGTAKRLLVTR